MKYAKLVLATIIVLMISACSQKVIVTPKPFASFTLHSHPPTVNVKVYRECLVERDKELQECVDMKDVVNLMNKIIQQNLIMNAYEKDISAYMESVK